MMKLLGRISGLGLRKKSRSLVMLGLSLTLALAVTGCGKSEGSGTDTITIASKGFGESDILANAISQLIEHDTKLNTKIVSLGPVWEALEKGEIDTYIEYTGTALIKILKEKPENDPQKVYDIVKEKFKEKHQVEVLDQLGFNNTYGFVMRKEFAEKQNIKSISDLAAHSKDLVFGTSQDFLMSEDTWPVIQKVYNPQFKEIKNIPNRVLAYKAIEQNLIDVTNAYTTDSQIPLSNFVVLKDDKQVFVPYYAIPLIRGEVVEKHPELREIINKLAGRLDDDKMQRLNGEVDVKQRTPKDVAKEWLESEGLLK
ncbi:glycine/betaine ABC transporter substrate-binding protein [Paenibacillus sp. JW14]|uniref:Glycine/betaine ABC transporter substrate-binding protein n=2 Tax=Paenibacillus agri TaxID=2744309 RepID=A0A850EGR6_9BACL|nr:glycine/betaine ABC transporter substrate-binding protein [Paenibacillus agri]